MSHKERPAYLKALEAEGRAFMVPSLTERDWAEVYYALSMKADRIDAGDYGVTDQETNVEEWSAQLRSIMAQIENMGINY